MDPNNKALQSTKNAITTVASIAASSMLARSLIDDYLPTEARSYLWQAANLVRARLYDEHTVLISERECNSANRLYDASRTYLATKVSTSMKRLWVSKVNDDDKKPLTITPESGKELIDTYDGIEFKWRFPSKECSMTVKGGIHVQNEISFVLTFNGKHKDLVMNSYLPHILATAREMKAQERAINLFANEGQYWTPSVQLQHAATFDMLAMDLQLKKLVIDDLARFVKKKEYYNKIGKAWKRGYLLHGPPGTGKSTLVAAMASYLKFDIYDLQLAEVSCNKSLQKLLAGMANKSILVVEDIDCSTEMMNRKKGKEQAKGQGGVREKVTLSGLLNSIDGLWSSSGEARIIVFTTNHKNKLDPALLRPGRMDMHIHMGYCGVEAFRTLASNYVGIDDHPLFAEIEGLIQQVKATPAEVAEQLMRSDDAEIVFTSLIRFLEGKRKDKSKGEEEEAKEENNDDEEKGGESEEEEEEEEGRLTNISPFRAATLGANMVHMGQRMVESVPLFSENVMHMDGVIHMPTASESMFHESTYEPAWEYGHETELRNYVP